MKISKKEGKDNISMVLDVLRVKEGDNFTEVDLNGYTQKEITQLITSLQYFHNQMEPELL